MKFKASEIRSRVGVLRLAAEVIAQNLEVTRRGEQRHGCCSAFDAVRDVVWDEYNEKESKLLDKGFSYEHYKMVDARKTRNRRFDIINNAQEAFEERFKPEGFVIGYWMGPKRHKTDQERRINALLSTAAAL